MSKKEQVLHLLKENAFNELLEMFDEEPNMVRKYLTRLTYHQDTEIRERAAESFGFLTKKRAQKMPQFFRETIRRHLWGMNDESGNMDWAAPEIIAQIIVAEHEMYGEFASIMIEAALNEPIFEESLIQAIKILRAKDEKFIEYHLPILKEGKLILNKKIRSTNLK